MDHTRSRVQREGALRGALFLALLSDQGAPARSQGYKSQDWYRCCGNRTLHFFDEGAGNEAHLIRRDEQGHWAGAVVAVVEQLSAELGFRLRMLAPADCDPPPDWNHFHCRLGESGEVVPFARMSNDWYTLDTVNPDLLVSRPLTAYKQAGLIRRVREDAGLFQLFAPFTGGLWLAVCGATVLVGVLLPWVLLEEGRPVLTRASPRSYLHTLYHVFSELMGGSDFEWTQGLGARLLRTGWLFMILVTTTSYTANLAAFFTQPAFRILGPQSMAELQRAKACLPVMDPSPQMAYWKEKYGYGHLVQNLTVAIAREDVGPHGLNATAFTDIMSRGWGDSEYEALIAPYSALGLTERIDRCAEKLRRWGDEPSATRQEGDNSGTEEGAEGPSVILYDRPQLQRWLLGGGEQRCREWLFAPEISFHDTFVHLSFNRSIGVEFFQRFQQGLLWLHKHGSMATTSQILAREFLQGEACPAIESLGSSEKINLHSQLGLFLIFGTICTLSIIAALAEGWHGRRRIRQAREGGKAGQDEGPEMTDGEMLRYLVRHVRALEDKFAELLPQPLLLAPSTRSRLVVDRAEAATGEPMCSERDFSS